MTSISHLVSLVQQEAHAPAVAFPPGKNRGELGPLGALGALEFLACEEHTEWVRAPNSVNLWDYVA